MRIRILSNMTTRSHNLAEKQSRNTDINVEATTSPQGVVANATEASQLATKCLHYKTVKEWALDFGVSERTVQRWMCSEQKIPARHVIKIIVKSKGYFMNMSKVESAIDEMLMKQFGSNMGEF